MSGNTLLDLILRAASDRAFRRALLADPDRALAELGLCVETGVRVALHKYAEAARRTP